jgi:asparagine synthase (glutamine-hydrolysing)
MCGIAGGFWTASRHSAAERLASAPGCMRHRGPNDHGIELVETAEATIAVGQTRLSVIDLTAGGHQPVLSDDGRIALVFNGEIYNYRELRDELRAMNHGFKSQSDTEVLLAAWSEWGPACLPRLDGMFAFVVHDRMRQELTCVRDAFGIKPFFYEQTDTGLLFASEQPALLALRGRPAKADLQRAYDYLVNGIYDGSEFTFVEGVRHLKPGHLLRIDLRSRGQAAPERWWRAPTLERTDLKFDQAVEAVRSQFLDNVRLQLRSDVPLGAALSGGIDSSAVVCAMRHVEPKAPIHTFSYIANGSSLSEESWVDLVNEAVGAVPHKISASAVDLANDVDAIVRTQGEPFGSTSIYAQYLVFKLAHENGITVTLDGQGADELLAGYIGYPGQRMLSLAERRQFAGMHRFARRWSEWPGRSYKLAWMYLGKSALPEWSYAHARNAMGRSSQPDWLNVEMLMENGVELREVRPGKDPANRGRRVVEQLAYGLQERGLPHLLRHGDRNAMAFSIESRVPFLTLPLANLLLSLPENYLISDSGETKHVFRAAMRGIVPDAILDRRDKIGFATPEMDWLRAIAPTLRHWLAEMPAIAFLNRDALLAAFDRVIAGQSAPTWQLWRWVNYVRWFGVQNQSV